MKSSSIRSCEANFTAEDAENAEKEIGEQQQKQQQKQQQEKNKHQEIAKSDG
jgi:hypothetical protein